MKEAPPTTDAPPASSLFGFFRDWDRFWFAPRDPTTLGFIRICCGLLTLYVHFAYSFDLYEFFGKNAWLSLARANENRLESPWLAPAATWEGMSPSLFLPPEPEDREKLLAFIRDFPRDPADRETWLGYVHNPELAPAGIVPGFIRAMPADVPGAASPRGRGLVVKFIRELPENAAEREEILNYMKRWGTDPRQLSQTGYYTWSIWYHVTDPFWMTVTHCLILVVILMFAVGFCTRLTSVLTWLAAVSYIQRSPVSLFGADTMMNILLIYLMIGPSGAALSVDRLLARWWAVRKARLAGLPEPAEAPPKPLISANFALRLMQIHFCLIYFFSGTSKLLGGNWWNGTAVYYTMANYEFSPLRYTYYLDMLRWLCQRRWLWELSMGAGSYLTLMLEIGLPFLVWNRRLRPIMVFASVMLHTAIAVFMGLATFSLLMATMVLCFVPGATLERLLNARVLQPLRNWFLSRSSSLTSEKEFRRTPAKKLAGVDESIRAAVAAEEGRAWPVTPVPAEPGDEKAS